MPTTRKKVNKIVYNEDSESEKAGDFTDSGSEAHISEDSNSDEEIESEASSVDEFDKKSKKRNFTKSVTTKKPKFVKSFINKINKQISASSENENTNSTSALFSIKDLSDSDKLLPSVLNLSESDSSEDESSEVPTKNIIQTTFTCGLNNDSDTDCEADVDYKDVWVNNIQDNSEEVAKKTFLELEQHKTKIEEAKASVQNYLVKEGIGQESDVKDLLAQGEEVLPQKIEIQNSNKKSKSRKYKDDSDAEMEDWEEVKESKAIPQQGLQLVVDFPDAACRKKKKLDIEMMMKRKINRVKKEYQVYMHKVHVLCWLAHGNYVSRVLNDQELLATALSLVPSKECYPGERVDMKYVEQITLWYKDKLTLKQDKNEEKFRPKAPPLKDILLAQIKSRVLTTQKYFVFIFVSMLRALGLHCRLVFNFVTLPIKPPSSELCSLSTKLNNENKCDKNVTIKQENEKKSINRKKSNTNKNKRKMSQLDGIYDEIFDSESDFENIMQIDGNDDIVTGRTRRTRSNKIDTANENEDVSPPKRLKVTENTTNVTNESKNQNNISSQKRKRSNKSSENTSESQNESNRNDVSSKPLSRRKKISENNLTTNTINKSRKSPIKQSTTRHSTRNIKNINGDNEKLENNSSKNKIDICKTSDTNEENISSKYFESKDKLKGSEKRNLPRKRTLTSNPSTSQNNNLVNTTKNDIKPKTRTKSTLVTVDEKSKYFKDSTGKGKSKRVTSPATNLKINKNIEDSEDTQRVSHRDLRLKSKTQVTKNDVTSDLVNIIKKRVKEAKQESRKGLVKGKLKDQSDEDSDYLPVESPTTHKLDSDDDFKPTKISPKPSTSRKIDRRVLSSDEENTNKNKTDVWCEIFVEELEQWIAVDVIKGKVHCTNEIYNRATHPVTYVVGWDNNNYLKDLTRRYVPHWNTVTRKQRAEHVWWEKAVRPWLGPKTARDREEDEGLDRMQLEAPLPKSIAEYKNHPLYALKRHLLKFEAIYPPDAATLGFVRGEPVYARECVYTCRSRDTWLKEAKVVRLGEQPYKIVKARPKWDKLSNKLITDKPLEVFGSWQVQDYEPPEAENGIVPRNAYGNVELFKDCMLPKGTVHIKLPGLNKVARKLNIDCAPAMTGFEFNGGWSHPVYDGFVVCKEFEEVITEAWIKDQEEQERKEIEKMEARVYGNWKRLIRGLLIRERLKNKYGFEDPSTSQANKKSKGPRLIIKKKT